MPYTSPHADVEIPEVALPEFLLSRAEARGDKPAFVDGTTGRTLSHAQVADQARRVARGLVDRGMGEGDVMALFSPNLPEYGVIFHGTCLAGGINTTVNPRYNAEELGYQLKDSGARFLFTVPPFLDTALEATEGTEVEEVFVLGEDKRATPYQELVQASGELPSISVDPAEDIAALPYSSGTTGLPKGVMLTHRNMVANLVQMDAAEGTTEEDVLIGVLPFFHIYGMQVLLNYTLYKGTTLVTLPNFEMDTFLGAIQEHGVTRAHLVPPIVLGLAKHPIVDEFDTTSLQMILSGAAPLAASTAQACAERVGCTVKQGYGLTETAPVTHVNPDDPARIKADSVGPALPNTEWRIVDVDDGQDVELSERGEVWIRGPQVMKGYLNREEDTDAMIDADGWLHTGDVGIADEDGHLYVVDRVKELIKYKGFQVPPAELEGILVDHPKIQDAAVIGVPDEAAGELPKAFVVTTDELTEQEVKDHVAEHVSTYKQVRMVEFVDEIPKTASGKILRRELK